MYNKVDETFIAGLQAIVGKENVCTDPDTLDQYKTDEETDPAKFHTKILWGSVLSAGLAIVINRVLKRVENRL